MSFPKPDSINRGLNLLGDTTWTLVGGVCRKPAHYQATKDPILVTVVTFQGVPVGKIAGMWAFLRVSCRTVYLSCTAHSPKEARKNPKGLQPYPGQKEEVNSFSKMLLAEGIG